MSCHEEKSRLSYQFSKTQNFYDGQKVITHSDPKWLLWQSIIHWVKLGGWVGGAQLSFMGYSPNSHSGFPSQSQSLNNILFWTPWSSRILQTFLIPLKQDAHCTEILSIWPSAGFLLHFPSRLYSPDWTGHRGVRAGDRMFRSSRNAVENLRSFNHSMTQANSDQIRFNSLSHEWSICWLPSFLC